MALMGRGELGGLVAGQVALALLVAAGSGALPATMAELAPWRVRFLLPRTAPHRLTKEFEAARFR